MPRAVQRGVRGQERIDRAVFDIFGYHALQMGLPDRFVEHGDPARLHIEHTVRMDSSSALATWSVVCANFQSGFELRAL